MQILIVSSREMLVKGELMSKLLTDNGESSVKWNESLTVYSFLVKVYNIGPKS